MLYTPITKKAIRYCFDSHAGQFDKSGIPYVTHPLHLGCEWVVFDGANVI